MKIVIKPVRSAHQPQFLCLGESLLIACNSGGMAHFQRRHIRHQMKGLEDDADMAATEQREAIFIQPGKVLSHYADCTPLMRSSPATAISRVDLPEPDGPTIPTASPLPMAR